MKKLRQILSLALLATFFFPAVSQAGPGEEIKYWLDQTVNVFECGRDRISSFMPSRNFTTDRNDTYSIDLNYDYNLNMVKISVQGSADNAGELASSLDRSSEIEKKLDASLSNNPTPEKILYYQPHTLPLNTRYYYPHSSAEAEWSD